MLGLDQPAETVHCNAECGKSLHLCSERMLMLPGLLNAAWQPHLATRVHDKFDTSLCLCCCETVPAITEDL